MAKTLWDDLKFHAGIAGDNFTKKSTVGKLLAGLYDSVDRQVNSQNHMDDAGNFYPGQQPGQLEDAFNVAGAAMVGGMPGVPKGSSPSTLGMAFRRPQDVVYTSKGEFNPTSSTLKEDFGDSFDLYNLISRYHNKTWGTAADPVIQHIDKGFKVPEIPGLQSSQLNSYLDEARRLADNELLDYKLDDVIHSLRPRGGFLTAKTDVGKYVEGQRDIDELSKYYDSYDSSTQNADFIALSLGMPQKTKDYAINTADVAMFSRPSISSLASKQLPYEIKGNLNRMSLSDLLMQASEKEAALAKMPDAQLHTFDDGHYWIQLKTQAQREAESEAMGNSTRLPMHDGKDLYSLRDKNGKSLLTASRRPDYDKFDEIKNKGNHVDVLNNLRLGQDSHGYQQYAEVLRELLGLQRDKWPIR